VKIALMLSLLTLAHDFYSYACCANRDCRPVPCEEITSAIGGWFWGSIFFKHSMEQTAPDGRCHVCVSRDVGHQLMKPNCIYLPPRTT
jgi:hypothetical protein